MIIINSTKTASKRELLVLPDAVFKHQLRFSFPKDYQETIMRMIKTFHKQLIRHADRVATFPQAPDERNITPLLLLTVCHMLPLRCNSKLQPDRMYIKIIKYYGMT